MEGGVFVKIIGLTGPSGAGKSRICVHLAKEGFPSINADHIYHKLLTPPSPCLDAIAEYFGDSVIKPDGSLDRRALASVVFAEGAEDKHEALNRITHHFVIEKMLELIEKYSSAPVSAIIVDVPLLFESEFHKKCDLTVAVLANRQVRIDRIMNRDGIDYAAASARVSAQQPDEFYTSRADVTVYNNSDEAALDTEAEKIIAIIREMSHET